MPSRLFHREHGVLADGVNVVPPALLIVTAAEGHTGVTNKFR